MTECVGALDVVWVIAHVVEVLGLVACVWLVIEIWREQSKNGKEI